MQRNVSSGILGQADCLPQKDLTYPEPCPGASESQGAWVSLCPSQNLLVIVLPQMVWASSNRLGCAIHTCGSINVWGSTWRHAVYLVCNYAIK